MSSLAKSSQQALDYLTQPSRRRPLFVVALICLFAGALWAFSPGPPVPRARAPPAPVQTQRPAAGASGDGPAKPGGTWDYKRDWLNYRFTDAQCDKAFPKLFEELDRSKADRGNKPITLQELDAIPRQNGYVRGIVHDQQVRPYEPEYSVEWTNNDLHSSTSMQHRARSIRGTLPSSCPSTAPS